MERKKYWSVLDGDNGVLHCRNNESIEAMLEQFAKEFVDESEYDEFMALSIRDKLDFHAFDCIDVVNHDNQYPEGFCMWDFPEGSPVAEYEGVEIQQGRAEYVKWNIINGD